MGGEGLREGPELLSLILSSFLLRSWQPQGTTSTHPGGSGLPLLPKGLRAAVSGCALHAHPQGEEGPTVRTTLPQLGGLTHRVSSG